MSPRSNSPISPGCEDQSMNQITMHLNNTFKKPFVPQLHLPREMNPMYMSNGLQHHFMPTHGTSAFHRPPIDANGQPLQVN